MLGPPPPPPPGAPPPMMPPPPMAFNAKKGGGSDDRGALLKQIQKGKSLKKTVTNDKSAPILGKVSNNSSSHSPSPARIGGGGGGGGGSVGPHSLGGLFANGIPTLRPTGKRTGGTNGSGNASVSSSRQQTPESPSPKSFTNIQNELRVKLKDDNRNVQRGPPPPTPARTYNSSDDSSRQTFSTRNGSSNGLPQASSTTSLTSLNQGAGGAVSMHHRKSNSNVSMRNYDTTDASQNNNFPPKLVINHGKPTPAPKPPMMNGRAPPTTKKINNGRVGRTQSMRSPSPQSPENNNFNFNSKLSATLHNPSLGQSMVNLTKKNAVRPSVPPPSIPNMAPPVLPSKTVKPPSQAPPPPPNVIPQPPNQAPPPPPHRTGPSRPPPSIPIPLSNAPPPPPRKESIHPPRRQTTTISELETRFAFHTMNEFPKPMPFRGVKKVYTSRQVGSKQQAPLPPNQIQLANRLWESSTC